MLQLFKKYQVPFLLFGVVIMCIGLYFMTLDQNELQLEEQKQLSEKDYDLLRDKLIALTSRHDPRESFSLLRKSMKENAGVTASCHLLSHDIGHAAYRKYEEFGKAMLYKDEICNAGYIHGVIESYFSEDSDITEKMRLVCGPYVTGAFTRWQCDHGIGHGLMFATNNDLPKALQLCETLSNEGSKHPCISGVFMENVMADQENHTTKYLKRDDPFYPCQIQEEKYKGHCYGYSPTNFLKKFPGEYEKALIWCKTGETPFVSSCAQGVGSKAIVENIEKPERVLRFCMKTDTSLSDPCIRGMIYEYINHYGSIIQAEALCQKFPDTKKVVCEDALQSKEHLF